MIRQNARQQRRSATRGLTLVELLVAVALGAILIGTITFIWLQSSRIFNTTVNTLESYQRLRTVLDILERDLANANKTVDMEPFQDNNGNGHYDAGDQLRMRGPATGVALAAAAPAYRAPVDPNDPVVKKGEPEFANDAALQTVDFFYGPFIYSPPPYTITTEGYLEGRNYWRDEIFFRTFLNEGDISKPAMVHYRLVQGDNGRSLLRRRSWSADRAGRIVEPSAGNAATDRATILSSGLCDLKFGFFFRPSAVSGDEGALYHVGSNATPHPDLDVMQCDKERGFRKAIDTVGGIMLASENELNGHDAVMFFYKGVGKIELTDGFPTFLRSVKKPPTSNPQEQDMTSYTNFGFSGVRPGDRMFLSNAIDDDSAQAAGVTGAAAPAGIFPDQEYTIDAIAAVNDFVGVKFKESINFFNLSRRWLGNEYGGSPGSFAVTTGNMGTNGGPPRLLRSSFNVDYRVGFLPAAVLVRMSIDDPYNRQVHQVERTIRLLQH